MNEFGTRLKNARIAAGYSLRDLAENIGVSAQAISKYERSMDMPSSSVLMRLTKVLGVDAAFLMQASMLPEISPAYRRSPYQIKNEASIIAQLQAWLERYRTVESLYPPESQHTFQLPNGFPKQVQNKAEIETAAQLLRQFWELGEDPIDSLMELLEDRGIKIDLIQGAAGFDACVFVDDSGTPFIASRDGLPGDRQRFNLSHELAHLLLEPAKTLDAEDCMQYFAGAFLIPATKARYELGENRHQIDIEELHTLKHKYGASMQAWLFRAYHLGILSQPRFKSHMHDFSQRGWVRLEPGQEYPPEQPKRLRRLVARLLAEGIINESRAAELLGMSLKSYLEERETLYGN